MKVCRRCGEEKAIEAFPLHQQRGVARRRSYCKPCHAANSKESRTRNLDAARARELAYARANAPRKRENALRWYYEKPENKAKAVKRAKAAYASDPEHKRDQAHMTRARRHGAKVVDFVRRREVYERDAGVCHICSEQIDWDDYDMDHLTPLGMGGDHTYENVKASHRGCNRRRRGIAA
jgi:hypothetical protein